MFRLFALLVFAVCTCNSFGQTICSEKSIHSDDFVVIGGIKQWVTIHGDNCNNPIVLFLHGGPGLVDSPASRSQYGYWEKEFTIVQWDQRGAGKTYGANQPPTELTLDEMITDGIELSEYLANHLGQEKIIITGASWGSSLGMYLAKRRPDLYHAYIGRSQAVSLKRNLDQAKKYLLTLASNNNDQTSIDILNSLNNQWNTEESVMKFHQVQEKYKAPPAESDKNYEIEGIYNNKDYFQLFQKAAEFSQSQAFNGNKGGLATAVDLYQLGFDYQVPLFFIQGEKDLMTMASTTEEFVDQLTAPYKEIILVPNRGHDSAFIEANYQVLKEKVLPMISKK